MTKTRFRGHRGRRRGAAGVVRFENGFRFGPTKARGAALTEFSVLTIMLVPLLFGTAMIGRLIDVRQTAVQASRYAAWETTVSAHPEAGADVGRRFFGSGSRAPTGDAASGEEAASGEAVASHGASTAPMTGVLGDTRVVVDPTRVRLADGGNRGLPGVAGAMGTVVDAAGKGLGTISGNAWDLPKGQLVRRGVTVPVDGNAWLGGGADDCTTAGAYACLTELSVIVSDGWSAPDPKKAGERSRSLVPASGLKWVGDLLSTVSVVPVLKELGGLDGALGKVNTTVLPPSETGTRRLEAYDGEATP